MPPPSETRGDACGELCAAPGTSAPPQCPSHDASQSTCVPPAPSAQPAAEEALGGPLTPREQEAASRARARGAQRATAASAATTSPLLEPPPLPQPHLVTFVTHEAPALAKLRSSAAAIGAALQVVVTRERFGPHHGWGPRLRALHAYVSDAARFHDAAALLIMVDGFDVLVKRDLRFAAAEFAAVAGAAAGAQPAVLLSAETNCAPDGSIAHRFPPTGTPYPFPNAGTIMGHVGAFRSLLGAHLPEFDVPMDDQAWWQARYLEDAGGGGCGAARVLLDAHARVFQCLWGAQTHFERGAHGLWRNRITGMYPVIFHGNGGLNAFLFETFHDDGDSDEQQAEKRAHCEASVAVSGAVAL